MDFAQPEAHMEQDAILDGGAKKKHGKRSPAKKHHKKHSPKKHSPKRKLSSPLRRWNQIVYEVTGSRRPLRKDDPMYAKAKAMYNRR
jgi:hypothetical protein